MRSHRAIHPLSQQLRSEGLKPGGGGGEISGYHMTGSSSVVYTGRGQ